MEKEYTNKKLWVNESVMIVMLVITRWQVALKEIIEEGVISEIV